MEHTEDDCKDVWDSDVEGIEQHPSKQWVMNIKHFNFNIFINYCPFCGKNLEEN